MMKDVGGGGMGGAVRSTHCYPSIRHACVFPSVTLFRIVSGEQVDGVDTVDTALSMYICSGIDVLENLS